MTKLVSILVSGNIYPLIAVPLLRDSLEYLRCSLAKNTRGQGLGTARHQMSRAAAP